MKAKTVSLCPKMQWLVMDVMDMKIQDDTVDVVLDKGTLDAIFSTPKSGPQVSDSGLGSLRARRMLPSLSSDTRENHQYRLITFPCEH